MRKELLYEAQHSAEPHALTTDIRSGRAAWPPSSVDTLC